MPDPPPSPSSSVQQALDSAASDKPMIEQLTGNPYFTAGFGLAALAAVAAAARNGLKHTAHLLYRRMILNVEVTRNDEAYDWLLRWMYVHHNANATETGMKKGVGLGSKPGLASRIINSINPRLHNLQFQSIQVTLPDGAVRKQFSLVPGFSRHIIRYKNAFIAVNRQRESTFDMSTGTPFETVTLTTLYSHRHILTSLFSEARALALKFSEGKTRMLTPWGSTEWKNFGEPKRKRPLDSVVLEEGLKERIVDDIRGFISSRTWYLDRGIPYRRGYLLHGPPGTGKSSFIQALAGELDYDIAVLNVSERGMTDDKLNHLLTKVPPRTFVLLEDADAAFINRRTVDADGYSGPTVTFSGLLNALDGVASAEERIMFLTTNHVDRLDEALIRPGRIDMSVKLGNATQYQIEKLWDRFYADFDVDGSAKRRFLETIRKLGLVDRISTAALQGLFLHNKDNVEGAITSISSLAGSTAFRNDFNESQKSRVYQNG